MSRELFPELRIEDDLQQAADLYAQLVKDLGLSRSDKLVEYYGQEVSSLKQGDTLSNDRIRYYLSHMAHESYRLATINVREGLKKDIAELHAEVSEGRSLVTIDPSDYDRKLIREEKVAIAALEAHSNNIVALVYKRVSEAISDRIYHLGRIQYNLTTMANMNMSEARLVQQGGNVI